MLAKVLGIKWHQFVSNIEMWRISQQPLLTLTTYTKLYRVFLCSLDEIADTKKLLSASPRKIGRDHMDGLG